MTSLSIFYPKWCDKCQKKLCMIITNDEADIKFVICPKCMDNAMIDFESFDEK